MRSKTFTTHRYGAAWTLALVLAWATAGARAAHDTDTIPQSVQAAMARANLPLQSLSVLVQPAGSGPALLSVAPERAMNPASIAKLVTTSAGLDLLGPTYVWHTDFLTDGVIRDGHLRGNLYVRGGGDPKLVLERIEAIYAQLQAQGIRAIDGDMVSRTAPCSHLLRSRRL